MMGHGLIMGAKSGAAQNRYAAQQQQQQVDSAVQQQLAQRMAAMQRPKPAGQMMVGSSMPMGRIFGLPRYGGSSVY